MERFLEIINKGIELGATDIHLLEGSKPLYRVKRALITNYEVEPMTKYEMVTLLEAMVGDNEALMDKFEQTKRIDIPYDVNEGIRLRINASLSSGTPTFSIRVIRTTDIDIDAYRLREILQEIRKHKTGLVLITGKVNSGKTTTLNAFVQDINKMFTKKIVMLEEPVEYIHKSNKSFIVQKEVGVESDVPSYYEGVINLLREDSDIAIVGEIRDRETMDAVIDLAEAGGLVIGTLHTRSCGETIDRIIGMYEPSEHRAIKNTLSNVLKLVVSQKLVNSTDGNVVLAPEIMTVNPTIAALIRQERFSISEIQDAIHHSNGSNLVSFERSFTKLYKEHIIDLETIEQSVEPDSFKLITNLIGGGY